MADSILSGESRLTPSSGNLDDDYAKPHSAFRKGTKVGATRRLLKFFLAEFRTGNQVCEGFSTGNNQMANESKIFTCMDFSELLKMTIERFRGHDYECWAVKYGDIVCPAAPKCGGTDQ